MADPTSLRRIAHSPAPFSTWLGVVLLFILFGVIVLAVIAPSPRGSDYEQMRANKRMERLKTLREQNEKELTTYAWVDKNKGVARIPINRAMELEVSELAQRKPAPAGPITTPATPQMSTAPAISPASGAPSTAGASGTGAAQQTPQASAPAVRQPAGQSPSPAAISPVPASTP